MRPQLVLNTVKKRELDSVLGRNWVKNREVAVKHSSQIR